MVSIDHVLNTTTASSPRRLEQPWKLALLASQSCHWVDARSSSCG